MPVQTTISKIARKIGETKSAVLISVQVGVFALIYGPLTVAMVLFDRYLHTVDTITVLLTSLLAAVVPAIVASCRVDFYSGTVAERIRENRAWWLLATSGLVIFVGRAIYAWDELITPGRSTSITFADALFGFSMLLILGGLILIPWSARRRPVGSSAVSALIVVIATLTLFWPIMIGPAITAGLAGELDLSSFANYLFGVFILTFTILWIMMRDIRQDLWPTAVAFMISIAFMILIQIGLLAFLVQIGDEGQNVPLLVVNGATSASFVAIAIAGVLRLRALENLREQPSHADLVEEVSPVPFWQMVLPYPILILIVATRVGMEVFDWQQEHRQGMVIGVGIVVVLMMIWQVPILRYNQQAFVRVANASIRDALTGLFTHRALHDLLRSEVARAERTGSTLAVLFMDIDRFKGLNDTFGHQSGDQVIVSVADILTENVRSGDFAGRYGGEEFMVIAPDISRGDAFRLAERVRLALADQEFIFDGQRVHLTMSVGVAMYPIDSPSPEAVIDLADSAMYQSKQAGRNRTSMYRTVPEGCVSA